MKTEDLSVQTCKIFCRVNNMDGMLTEMGHTKKKLILKDVSYKRDFLCCVISLKKYFYILLYCFGSTSALNQFYLYHSRSK